MICLINQLCEVITNHKLRIITAECSSITCTNSYLNIKSSTAIYSCKRSDYQLHVLADVKWISHERYHRSWHFTTVLRTTIRSLFGSLSAAFKIRLDRYLAPKGLDKKITTECESVRNEIIIDIQMLTDKVNTFDTSLKKLQATNTKEINDIKARLAELENGLDSASNTAFNPDTTIVATGMGFSQDENIKDKAERFVRDGLGLDDISVINAMRTPFRNNKPGIVKIQFESKAEKERALDRRFNLKDSVYKRVFIRTSMSHTERLIHQNTKILLEAAGVTDSYTVLQSGRAVKKEILAQWKQNRNVETGTAGAQVGRG